MSDVTDKLNSADVLTKSRYSESQLVKILKGVESGRLSYLISEEFPGKWGLSISEYGEILDSAGTVVLRADAVNAVIKALTYL